MMQVARHTCSSDTRWRGNRHVSHTTSIVPMSVHGLGGRNGARSPSWRGSMRERERASEECERVGGTLGRGVCVWWEMAGTVAFTCVSVWGCWLCLGPRERYSGCWRGVGGCMCGVGEVRRSTHSHTHTQPPSWLDGSLDGSRARAMRQRRREEATTTPTTPHRVIALGLSSSTPPPKLGELLEIAPITRCCCCPPHPTSNIPTLGREGHQTQTISHSMASPRPGRLSVVGLVWERGVVGDSLRRNLCRRRAS